jgi:hypothetical protein
MEPSRYSQYSDEVYLRNPSCGSSGEYISTISHYLTDKLPEYLYHLKYWEYDLAKKLI